MSAGFLNLYYEQGILRPDNLRVEKPVGVPVDLTPYTASMDIRENFGSQTPVCSLTSAGGGLTLGGVLGTIAINVPANLPGGNFVYDLTLSQAGVAVERLVQGEFVSSSQVTI